MGINCTKYLGKTKSILKRVENKVTKEKKELKRLGKNKEETEN